MISILSPLMKIIVAEVVVSLGKMAIEKLEEEFSDNGKE